MKIGLLLTTFNRPDLLKMVLDSLTTQLPKNLTKIVIIDDCSTDLGTRSLLTAFAEKYRGLAEVFRHETNHGNADSLNEGLGHLFLTEKVDYAVVLDSDATATPDDWIDKLVSFLESHPEAGIAFPNRPGSYIRLHRDGYDEVEFGITICYAIPKKAYFAVAGDGRWFDTSLTTAWDCDTCYRLRRAGYRVAVVNEVVATDLGVGKSTLPSEKFAKGNFEFNKKWNELLLGPFIYKSPMMLRWEDYPLNMQFRRLVNAQQGAIYVSPTRGDTLSGHGAVRISYLSCSGNFPTQENLQKWLAKDVWIHRNPVWEEIQSDLAAGKRMFDLDNDVADFQLRGDQAA